ncbi:MAG: amidohydrolase family protein [Hyphomicrobiales bacterium]
MAADIPLALGCFDHHTLWANTKALEAAGLMKGRKLPQGSEVVLDAQGFATGELREFEAFAPVLAMGASGGRESLGIVTGRDPVPAATPAQFASDVEVMRNGIAFANGLGITSMHNMDGNTYQLLAAAGAARHGRTERPVGSAVPFPQHL